MIAIALWTSGSEGDIDTNAGGFSPPRWRSWGGGHRGGHCGVEVIAKFSQVVSQVSNHCSLSKKGGSWANDLKVNAAGGLLADAGTVISPGVQLEEFGGER